MWGRSQSYFSASLILTISVHHKLHIWFIRDYLMFSETLSALHRTSPVFIYIDTVEVWLYIKFPVSLHCVRCLSIPITTHSMCMCLMCKALRSWSLLYLHVIETPSWYLDFSVNSLTKLCSYLFSVTSTGFHSILSVYLHIDMEKNRILNQVSCTFNPKPQSKSSTMKD